jgi:hypothetical protein
MIGLAKSLGLGRGRPHPAGASTAGTPIGLLLLLTKV